LTYLDVNNRKSRYGGGEDSDSDDGPPPDPDEPAPAPVLKKDKKPIGETKEIQVAARRAADDKSMQGGLSQARRDMLVILRNEEDEAWQDLDVFGEEVRTYKPLHQRRVDLLLTQTTESADAFESLLSKEDHTLDCQFQLSKFMAETSGL
jgi:DNA-directed RNA polymerase-3 subunit RPC5